MADTTSTLSIQIKTDQAKKALAELQAALAGVSTSMQALGTGVGAASKSAQDILKAARQLRDGAKATSELQNAAQRAGKAGEAFSLRFSQSFGRVSASAKLTSKTTVDELKKIVSQIEAAGVVAASLKAKQQEIAEKQAQKQHERILRNLAAREKARINLQDRYLAMDLGQQVKYLERAKRLREAGAPRSVIARSYGSTALKDLENLPQKQARLEAFKQKEIAERQAQKQHERTLRNLAARRKAQLTLQDRYNAMELGQRVKHLERMGRLLEAGASPHRVARGYGVAAFRDLRHLPAMQAQIEAQKQLNSTTSRGSGLLRSNAAAMRDAHSAARGLSGSLGTLWMTYGAIAPLLAGAAFGGMMRSTFSVGKDLEYRLKFVEALGNASVNVSDLTSAVQGSMKTPLEAAEAMQALAQAGLNTQQSLTALHTTLQLSTLGELSMEKATVAVTGALAAFNLTAAESGRVGDVFAKAAASSNTTVAKITESMKQASTSASRFGISLEETSAALVMMAKRNITGSAAGTAFKNMAKELYTPIARGAKALDQLGVSAYDAEGKSRTFIDILKDLKTQLAGLNDASQNKFLEAIFGERGARAASPILSDLDTYLGRIEELKSAQGFLASSSVMLLDTVEGASNRMQSTFQQSLTQAFDRVKGNVKSTILEIEKLGRSEGFINFVSGSAQMLVSLTNAVMEHSSSLVMLAKIYGSLKVAQMASAAVSAFAIQVRNVQLSLDRKRAVALTTETTALTANTAAQLANNASGASGLKRLAESVGGFGRLLSILGRVTSWIGLLVTAGTTLYDLFRRNANTLDPLIARMDDFRRSTESLNAQMQVTIENLHRLGKARAQGVSSEVLTAREAAERNQDELRQARARDSRLWARKQEVDQEAQDIHTRFLKGEPVAGGSRRLAKLTRESRQLKKDIAENRSNLDKLQATTDQSLENLVLMEKAVAKANKRTLLDEALARGRRILEEAKYAKPGEFKAGVEKSNLAGLIKQGGDTFEAEDVPDTVLHKIYQNLQDELSRLESLKETLIPGAKEPKPSRPSRLEHDDPNYVLRRLNERATKESLREQITLEKTLDQLRREQEKTERRTAEQYLNKDVIAGLREREAAEEKFNSLLDDRRVRLEELREARDAASDKDQLAKADEHIRRLEAYIAEIENRRSYEGYKAQVRGEERYNADRTFELQGLQLLQKYRNEAKTTGEVLAEAMEMGFGRATTALENFATTGKVKFRAFTVSLLQDLSSMAMRIAANQIIMGILGTIFGAGFGAAAGGGASGISGTRAVGSGGLGLNPNSGGPGLRIPSAKGNAFDAGRLKAFAKGGTFTNRIASRPTVAPMALFGEAGPEAIMPLTRTADGSLGVRAVPAGMSGDVGGGNVFYVNTTIEVNGDGSGGPDKKMTNNNALLALGDQLNMTVKTILVKECGQGGVIREAIRGAR